MDRHLLVRRLLLWVAILFLLATAWWTISGGVSQLPRAITVGQRIETAVQFALGLLSILTVFTCFRGQRWRTHVRIGWATTFAVTSCLSALVWGPPSVIVGLLLAMVAVLVSLGVIWMLRAGDAH